MIGLVRDRGGLVGFDADDLFFEPLLARGPTIDGIRSIGIDREEIATLFEDMRKTVAAADFCLATTEPLAASLRQICRRVHVLPNGFDDGMFEAARAAILSRAQLTRDDDTVRIGYALGTRTHQRDFAAAAAAVAAILAARAQVRLVLFRTADGPLLDLDEFPMLAALADQIEWRDLVAFDRLPAEIARFDVAICPLEIGNPFVEAKSEIKFVEAALAAVPVVASPTDPFRRAIRDGVTGFLASTEEEWRRVLLALVDAPDRRAAVGRAAAASVLWTHGPKRRAELLAAVFRRHEAGATGAREAELAIRRGAYAPEATIALPPTVILFDHDDGTRAEVAVALTSKDYGHFIGDALGSVEGQTLRPLELVVIDDGSSDDSVGTLIAWADAHRTRFCRIRIERTVANSGLGPARNAAFAAAHAPFVMSLDADNLLLPGCCETLLGLITRADCAFAHSAIEQFGDAATMLGTLPFDPARLVPSNYIDAMALVARWAWSGAGGYYDNPTARGWEDYDLWCRLAELGQFGVWHSKPLCRYRAHGQSMTDGLTERPSNKAALIEFFEHRHDWLRLESRDAHPRATGRSDRPRMTRRQIYTGSAYDTHVVAFVTFKFRMDRLQALFETVRCLQGLPSRRVEVNIFTETDDARELNVLRRLFGKLAGGRFDVQVVPQPEVQGDPFMLGWAHKPSLAALATSHSEFTHVLCLEEDIQFCAENLAYFCRFRGPLARHGLIPGFVRYEFNRTVGDIFTADQQGKQPWRDRTVLRIDEHDFAELDVPYCAMFLLDRDLLVEYVLSRSFDPRASTELVGWGIRERAAMGLSWERPPAGFRSRVVVPLVGGTRTPHHSSWVFHAPSNYTNDQRPGPNWILGKTRMDDIFADDDRP